MQINMSKPSDLNPSDLLDSPDFTLFTSITQILSTQVDKTILNFRHFVQEVRILHDLASKNQDFVFKYPELLEKA